MNLLTIVSAIIFLTFGTTVLVYFLKIIISAFPWGNPFEKLKQIQLKNAIESNQKFIAGLQAAQKIGDIDALRKELGKVATIRPTRIPHGEEVPVLIELYLTVLDSSVSLLEETGMRYSALPRFEELIQERGDLLSRFQEVLSIKAKLARRSKEGEKPKEWAIKEVSSQERTIKAQLIANMHEINQGLFQLIEISARPKDQSDHKYH